ncbi:MAG: NADH-quinone oxidoreductase subunit A [Bdellovibrio sp.]|nr:NADH-quinone oxidoreductase subunit A [Bdellovibrio sp.]
MATFNMDVYLPIFLLIFIALLIIFGALILSYLIRPSNPSLIKQTAYECGELPVGTAWANFNVRFYVVALVFIIFDVESALMFPVVAVYKRFLQLGSGGAVLLSLLVFIGVLIQGVIYCWRKGDLDWIKSYRTSSDVRAKGLK